MLVGIGFLICIAFALHWKITQDRIARLKKMITRQERLLDNNLAEVREEYARIFMEVKRKESARELFEV